MSPDPAPLMRLRRVTRNYVMGDNVVRALADIDLEIRRGEFVMVVGSSGSGKSTLMHILGCLDAPTTGEYYLDDIPVHGLDDESLSRLRNRRIGFVFQQFNLLGDLNALDNIALPLVYTGLPRSRRLELAGRYAAKVGLGERGAHRPSELSGGQSQRVAIARALVNEPAIIFADEPTGNLDSATGREVMELLFGLNDLGYTVVMVTHDPKLADEGSRRITFRDGRIVDDRPGHRPPATTEQRTLSGRLVRGAKTASLRAQIGSARRMSLIDLLRIGVREGLLAHKMRTALTMLGIVIAVAGVIAMSSFSLGSKRKQADQVRALGANLVRVQDQRLEGEKLTDARIGGSQGLRRTDFELLCRTVPGVTKAAASREIKMSVLFGGRPLNPRLVGVTGDYLGVNNLRVARGRFLDSADGDICARVVVIGAGVAGELGANPLGRQLLMGGAPYTVVGVLANRKVDLKGLEASGVADANFDVLLPLETLQGRTRQLDMRSELDEIQFQLATEEMLYDAGTTIRRELTVTHGGVKDFDLVVPLDLLKQKQQAQELLNILTICISSIALIVGGIGIMNIMLASVTERIREIGVRRAVGATRRDIRRQFLSESVIIAVTGGGVGILLSLGVVVVTCHLLDIPVVISSFMVLLSVLAATATGLVFGLYPAAQAARKKPVEALRYE